MEGSRPDLIVGVDVGMTCTGIAFANPMIGSDAVRWIQRWPGRMQANENKVPTILVYPIHQAHPSSWGFLADTATAQTSQNVEHREWFKIYLEESTLQQLRSQARDPADVPSSVEEVEKWFTDYLRYIHQHIKFSLQNELSVRWEDARIEFIFSVPTTWKPYPTVERFRSICERAGFKKSPYHKVVIGLTEAEAAAVQTAKASPAIFQERDILLICDVGGGTTDLSALRVLDTASGLLSLEQLDTVFGKTIGASQIDRTFEKIILDRLKQANESVPLNIDLEDAAWEIMKGKEYQNAKCEFGSYDSTEFFSIAIPRADKLYRNEAVGIIDGELRVHQSELQSLFDTQVSKLFDLIDTQLQRIQQRFPSEQVAHMILSGGLGNSAYIQQRLRRRYAFGMDATTSSNGKRLQVRVAPEPQLVVCKGLVADRLGKLKGRPVLKWRCCRASYGTKCRILYDHKNPAHFGQKTVKDPADGKLYIEDVIDWFIREGEPVSMDQPVVRRFQQRVSPYNPIRVFPTDIIVSYVNKPLLPLTMDKYCSPLCQVQSDFSDVEPVNFKVKNRHWWSLGPQYYRIDYEVKVAFGPADITFELWFNNRKLSKDNPIRVEWFPAPEIPSETGSTESMADAALFNPLHFQQPIAQRQQGVQSTIWDDPSATQVSDRPNIGAHYRQSPSMASI